LNRSSTVVDAYHFRQQLGDAIVREQVAFADVVVINKADVVAEERLELLSKEVRSLNRTATIIMATHSQVAAEILLGIRRFSLPTLLEIEPELLNDVPHDHEHDASIQSFGLVESGALDPDRFNRWINRLVQQQGQQLMRMKGVLHFHSEPRRFHFHSVHMLLEASPGRAWRAGEVRDNRFVVIGRNLDMRSLREGFVDCLQ
jgi:G3E family GTPase